MKLTTVFLSGALALSFPCHAGEPSNKYGAKPLKGNYQMYGGTLAEMLPPTSKDRKLSFIVKGPLAKDLFNQIGPDLKESCSSAEDYRERRRGDIDCVFTKADGYTCYFGLDVVTGKSTSGSIC